MRVVLYVLTIVVLSGCGEAPKGHKDATSPPSDQRSNSAKGSGQVEKIQMH